MIKKRTVLILGAGASQHVGYPLGKTLIGNLCKFSMEDDGKWKKAELEGFIKQLSRSGHYSIDAFLEQNPEHVEIGRFLIARGIKAKENVNQLFPPNDSGWYQYLFNTLVSDGLESFATNPLSIITFNYDRSLECYLHESLQARFRLSPENAIQHLRQMKIIHPHGMIGSYPEVPYGPPSSSEELMAISRGIKIIHEFSDADESGFCSPEFKLANEYLTEAQRIIFLGFGFHMDNVRRLNFFTPDTLTNREVLATTAGIGPATLRELIERFEAFGLKPDIFGPGYSCNDFFQHQTRL